MVDIQQLRQTLVEHEDLAPDGAGLIEAVQGAAARIRRRRRIGYTAGVALATAVVLGLAPAAVDGPSGGVGAATAGSAADYRGEMQLTLGIAGGSGYEAMFTGVVGSTQYAVVRRASDRNRFAGTVLVHDPSTYDGRRLLDGARVTVQGHPAYYVRDLPMGTALTIGAGPRMPGASASGGNPSQRLTSTPVTVPAVGWRDGSGAWVVVYADGPLSDPESELLSVAGAVRLGVPTDVRVPFQLGYVPAGLQPTLAALGSVSDTNAVVSFGGQPRWDSPIPPAGIDQRLPLGIQVLPRSDYVDNPVTGKAPTAQIAGHDVWYFTDPRTASVVVPPIGSAMIVHFGRCHMGIHVADRARIPYPELVKMVTNIRFADCTDLTTWTPPVR